MVSHLATRAATPCHALDNSNLRVQAVRQASGSLALLLLNEAGQGDDPTDDATVTVNLSDLGVHGTAQEYEYGWANVAANARAPYQSVLSGVGGNFTVTVPGASMVA